MSKQVSLKRTSIHTEKLKTKNYLRGESKFFMRIFDFHFAIIAIVITSPIMLVIMFLIKLNSFKGKIFFKQKRLGLNGELFEVYKFRTMVPDAEKKLEELLASDSKIKEEYLTYRKLKNDPRIIPNIGNFLRKTSLDELPQFFNVFLGQMTIVGPRPYIENEFDSFPTRAELKGITSVKPGITGYWQVIPERHDTTFESRVETDMEYIKKRNFKLDLKIIAQTFGVMALKKGA